MTDEKEAQSANWLAPEHLLQLFQSLATIAAAAWAIYMFFAFGRIEKNLDLELKSLSKSQAALDLQVGRLQQEETQIDLQIKQEAFQRIPINPDHKIVVEDLGPQPDETGEHVFKVAYQYAYRNMGVRKVEVSYVIVETFSAQLTWPAGGTLIQANAPGESGDIQWQHRFIVGHYYAPRFDELAENRRAFARVDNGKRIKGGDYIRGGGGTAGLDPGEDSDGSVSFFISARPNDLIGFVATIGFDGGETGDDRWRLVIWDDLAEDQTDEDNISE